MRHLILSFLVFSVNSFPQDLHNRFADDLELAYNSPDPDSYLFTDSTPADGSSDLFATVDDPNSIDFGNLKESLPVGTLDSAGTSFSPLNPGFEVAEWQEPDHAANWGCQGLSNLACCFHGGDVCVWYNSKEPHCYYEDDLRCCEAITTEEIGVECGPASKKGAEFSIIPALDAVGDVLRWEVPTGWLGPLLGGVGDN